MIWRYHFVHCVPVRIREGCSTGCSTPALLTQCRVRARRDRLGSAPGAHGSTAEGHRERISAGAWAMPFDAEILVQETSLGHFAEAITPITKSPRLPSADGRLVVHLNASLCSTTRCSDDFYAPRSRERPCPPL
jgi:hypothetical protein